MIENKHKQPKDKNFRWSIGLVDIKSNKVLYKKKNLDSLSFDKVYQDLKRKLE